MQSNVLPLFWQLASSSKDTRLGASADLVSSLQGFQQSFLETKAANGVGESLSDDEDEVEDEDSDESGEEVDEDDEDSGSEDDAVGKALDKQLASRNAEDVVYSVRRLVRGLASSRDSSRLGFAVALTELLSRIDSISAEQVLSLIIRSCPLSSSMKGQEQRDALFSRLFGFSALIQSGCILRDTSNVKTINSVIDHLIDLGKTKGWLRESAWWNILGIVRGLKLSEGSWKAEVVSHLVEAVYQDKVWTQEKVALTLVLENQEPKLDWKQLLGPTFKHTPLISSKNLSKLGQILKESGHAEENEDDADDDVAGGSTGSWKPQLHFVWDIMFDSYFSKTQQSSSPSLASFQEFFRVVVDESLFSNTASPERKYWGFLVLSRSIPLVSPSLLPMLFTPNVMRSWTNHLSSSDRYLHKAAVSLASQVQELVKYTPALGFTMLEALIQKGRLDFDKVTKTKTVETIMGTMNVDGVKSYVKHLEGVILGREQSNNDESTALNERRTWAVNQMYTLVKNGSVPKEDDWVAAVLDLLLVNGFFTLRKPNKKSEMVALHSAPSPALSENVAEACRMRFLQCILELSTASPSQSKGTPRQQGCTSQGKLWLGKYLDKLVNLRKETKHLSLLSDMDPEIDAQVNQAQVTLSALEKVEDNGTRKGAEILLSFSIFRVYLGVDDALDMLEGPGADAVNLTKEVNNAVSRMYSLATVQASSSSSSGEETETEPIDELLDVLIALLDKGSNDLRNLANMVVGLLAPSFTTSSIQHLVMQLEQNTADGIANELESEDEDDDLDMEDEDISMSDAGSKDSGSDDEEESSDEEEEEDDSDDEEAEVDPEFRRRVAEALQVAGMLDDGTGSSKRAPKAADDAEDDEDDDEVDGFDDEDDGSSSEEELWDDDQMLKVDEQLAEVFRQRAGTARKGNLKNLHTESQHFKHRILDFFDVFARKQPENPLILLFILPLLRVIQHASPTEIDLSNKAASLLRSRLGKAKEVPPPGLTTMGIMEQVHQLARKAGNADFSALCGICSIYIFRSISSVGVADDGSKGADQAGKARIEQAVKIYGETLADYMERKSSLVHPPFVIEFIRRFPQQAFPLAPQILGHIGPQGKSKVYRQVQGYTMLQCFSQQLALVAKAVPVSELAIFLAAFAKTTYSLLSEVAKGAFGETDIKDLEGWNAQRLKDITKVVLHFTRTSKAVIGPQEYATVWDLAALEKTLEALKAGERTGAMKGVQGMLEQMLGVIRSAGTGGQKDKVKTKAKAEASASAEVSKKRGKDTAEASKGIDGSNVVVKGTEKSKKAVTEEDKSKVKKRKSGEGSREKEKEKEKEGKKKRKSTGGGTVA